MRQIKLMGSAGQRETKLVEADGRAPGPGEARVRVRAVSLNFRDLLIIGGMYPMGVKPDVIPVSDGAGEVIAVGAGVTHLKAGDRVASTFFPDWAGGPISAARTTYALGASMDGMLAEEVTLPASAFLRYPDHLSFEEAATLPCAGVTAWNALVDTAHVTAGATVLLQGTGGVSTFALQFAKAMGATVIQTSSSDEKLAGAKAMGADHLINYRSTPDWDVAARELTGGEGVDVVIEVGGAGTLEKSLRATRMGGTVATIGLVTGLGQIDPLPVISGVVNLSGVLVGSHDMHRDMCKAITAHKIKPLISARFTIDKVADALAALQAGAHGKIVINL